MSNHCATIKFLKNSYETKTELQNTMKSLIQISKFSLFNGYILKLLVNVQNIICEDSLKCRKYFSSQPRSPRAVVMPVSSTTGRKEGIVVGKLCHCI